MKAKLRRDWQKKKKGDLIEVDEDVYGWLKLRKRIEPIAKIENIKVEPKIEIKIDTEIKKRKKKIDPAIKTRKKKSE